MRYYRILITSFVLIFLAFFVSAPSPHFSTFAASFTRDSSHFKTTLSHGDFSLKENPEITIEDKPVTPPAYLKFIPKFIYSPPVPKPFKDRIKVVVTNTDGLAVTGIEPQITDLNGKLSVSLDKSRLKPGRYHFEVTSTDGGTIVQDFTWGVLSLNPDQSSYGIGDTAFLAMAVLNDRGDMVCDSQLSLTVTNPDGTITLLSTQNGLITINPVCHAKDVTLVPDYQALLPITQSGTYKLTLTSVSPNGTYSITDTIESVAHPDFVVKRLAATRIYPPNTYPVTLKITGDRNFTGFVTESVPSDFELSSIKGGLLSPLVTDNGTRKIISWKLSLKKGQQVALSYFYKAPLISPERYLLGPLKFYEAEKLIFAEPRQWQIASDAVATVTTTGASNWIVPANVYSIKVEAWGGGGGGGNSTGTTAASGGGGGAYSVDKSTVVNPGQTMAVFVGINGGAGVGGSDSYVTVVGAGTTLVLAKGGNGGVNDGLTGGQGGQASAGIGDTKYNGGNGGTTLGSSASGGGGGGAAGDAGAGGNGAVGAGGTGGIGVGTSGGGGGAGGSGAGGSNGSIIGGGGGGAKRTSGGTKSGGIGARGQVQFTYTVNSAPNTPTNSTPGIGASNVSTNPTLTGSSFSDVDVGDTQGYSQWQVATDTGFTSVVWDSGTEPPTTTSTVNTSTGTFQGALVGQTSLANSTIYYWHIRYADNHGNWSAFSTGTSFVTVAPANRPPSIPILAIPANGNINVSTTAALSIVSTDPDLDYLQYRIILGTNSSFTGTTQTFDQSASQTNWSGQNANSNTAYGSGTTATYTISTPLSYSTTYYWKAQAKDPAGTNTWSSLSSFASFTTVAAPNSPPNTPSNSTPGVGATDVSFTPTLTASTFSDPDAGNTQNASQWQLATDSGFTSIVFDTGTSGSASNSVNVSPALNIGTTYYWHVRYQDNNLAWSSYSSYTSFTTNRSPLSPTLTSPANNAVGVTNLPTLSLAAVDTDADPLQYRIILATNASFTGTTQTFDQHVSNTGWTNQNVGTSAYSSGTTASYTLSSPLSYSTVYYWQAQAYDYSGSNSWGNLSAGNTFTVMAAPNNSPNAPSNSTPANGAGGQSLTPTLTASTFSDPDAGDTQAASQWQLAADSGFTSIVFDTGTSGSASNSVAVTTTLNIGTTYYWHVRYQDNHNAWSSYSSFTNFTTNRAPNTPSNSTPGVGATDVSLTPTLTASAFSDPDAGNTQAASQWQLAADSGFTSIVFDTGTSGSAANSVNVSTVLSVGTTYYWHVRYQDNFTTWSSYSSSAYFTTNRAPLVPVLTSPANNAVGVTNVTTFSLVAIDTDADPLQYRIILATNASFTGTTQTFDQHVSNTGWTNQNVGTSAYSSGSTASFTVQSPLSLSTVYYWQAQAYDYSGSNSWSNLSVGNTFTTTGPANNPPNQPTNSTPGVGATGVSLTPTLTASAFSDPDAGNTQAASQWQLAADSGFSSIVFDTGTSGSAANSVNISSALNIGTTYYWHVRYQDNNNAWSSYSSSTYFTTNRAPLVPVLTSPANNAAGVTTVPTFSLVASDTDGNPLQYRLILSATSNFTGTTQTFDQHISNTGWTNQNVGTSAYSSGTTAVYTVQSPLAVSTIYYWKAQAIDYSGTNTWGILSVGNTFTTMSAPNQSPTAPTLLWTQGSVNPSGVPTLTPYFSAVYNDPDTSDIANKYEVQLDTTGTFSSPSWDSGTAGTTMSNCNQGGRCANITYSGSALNWATTYYWRIRYWDQVGATSPWSVSANFSTNQLATVPTLSAPGNGSTNVSTTPSLTVVSTDPDSDYLRYLIILATNSSFTGTTQTFDQTSSQTGWSGQNAQTSTAYNSGTTAVYVIQSALNNSQLYYWKAQTIDPAGTNSWTSLSVGSSFTTSAPANVAPGTPNLDYPANNSNNVSTTPTFKTTASDGNSDYLRYKIDLCTDLAMSVGCTTFDQTSSQVGWSGQNTQSNTAYNSGSQAAYTLQSTLANSTSYYWRSYAIDPAGTNSWSLTQLSPNKFTTIAAGGTSAPMALSSYTTTAKKPVLYYKFDEGNGTQTGNWGSVGSTVSVLFGTGTSAPTWTNNGKFGKALDFNAANSQFLNVNNGNSQLDVGQSGLTVSAWIYPRTLGSANYAVVGKNGPYLLWIDGTNKRLYTGLYKSSVWYWSFSATNSLSLNSWQHIVMTYDGISRKLYINGVQSGTTDTQISGNIDIVPASWLQIGRDASAGGRYYFDGMIDEVKVYNTPLTAAEVAREYNGGATVMGASSINSGNTAPASSYSQQYCVPGDSNSCSAPTLEWKIDEGVGTTVYDSSGNNHAGTFTSASWTSGHSGKGLTINSNLITPSASDLSSTDFTLNYWFKWNSAACTWPYIGKFNPASPDTANEYSFQYEACDGRWYFRANNSAVLYTQGNGQYLDMTLNKWHFISITYKSSTGKLRIVQNGNRVLLDVTNSFTITPTSLNFLASQGAANQVSLDNIQYFNYARTPSQVAYDYNRGAPVSLYKFDECSGTTIKDWSFNGNSGTLSVGPSGTQTLAGTCSTAGTAWGVGATGKINSSLSFDGTDDYVNVGNIGSTINSLSFWIKPASTTQNVISIDATRTITISSGTIQANNFSSASIYVDGVLKSVIPDTGWHYISIVTATGIPASAVKIANVGSGYYSGLIDDVRIFNYALTPSQINTIYNNGAVTFSR